MDKNISAGGDQLLVVEKPPQSEKDKADYWMKIFNADGFQVEMCGNGLRCFAKYLIDRGIHKPSNSESFINIYTLAGVTKASILTNHSLNTLNTTYVAVEMCSPVVHSKNQEVTITKPNGESLSFIGSIISIGNPHFVIKVDDDIEYPLGIKDSLVHEVGPLIENHPLFPHRTNVEFISIKDNKSLAMRVWERGSGETKACGSGACACAVAAYINGWVTSNEIKVTTLGGDLEIKWDTDKNSLVKVGPAQFEKTVILPLIYTEPN